MENPQRCRGTDLVQHRGLAQHNEWGQAAFVYVCDKTRSLPKDPQNFFDHRDFVPVGLQIDHDIIGIKILIWDMSHKILIFLFGSTYVRLGQFYV
jgi:hypothetical protein